MRRNELTKWTTLLASCIISVIGIIILIVINSPVAPADQIIGQKDILEYYAVFCDKETNVEYFNRSGIFGRELEPRYNADGTLKQCENK